MIFAIGNAPTALIRLYELIREGAVHPQLIIGVPVGFVNVVESKELMIRLNQKWGLRALLQEGAKVEAI